MPRYNIKRRLADDPYNDRRIFVLSCVHDAIYYLRHGPHRRNDVIETLEKISDKMGIAISSSVLERDPQFERLCRNLELMLPVLIRILNKHNDRVTDKEVADDLISCIPSVLQQPKSGIRISKRFPMRKSLRKSSEGKIDILAITDRFDSLPRDAGIERGL